MKLSLFIKKTSTQRILFVEILLGLAVSIIVLSLFSFLTNDVLEKETSFYDQAISHFVYSLRTPTLTTIMQGISVVTDTPVGLILSLVIISLLYPKHKKEAVILSISLIVGCVLNYLLKLSLQVSRPTIASLQVQHDFSYPSGHAMNNLVFYGLLVFLIFRFTKNKLLSIIVCLIGILWVLIIGFSRVYLGVHYPSDVIGGYLLGLWWLITVLVIDRVLILKRVLKGSL